MTEIPFEWLMADALLLATGLYAAVGWCPFLIDLVEWNRDPVTLRKAGILFFGMFIPLAVCWLFIEIFVL